MTISTILVTTSKDVDIEGMGDCHAERAWPENTGMYQQYYIQGRGKESSAYR